MIIMDIEANGLLETVTKIHCAVAYDTITKHTHVFTPGNINEFLPFLKTVKKLSMHNGIGYDLKLIKKLYGYEYKGDYVDTLMLSRIFWPDKKPNEYYDDNGKLQKCKSRHGVENWGVEFGIAKPVHEDWTTFTPEMLHRCREDVKIQTRLYEHIVQHMKKIVALDSRITNAGLKDLIKMEHDVFRIIEQQADNGWLFDLKSAYNLADVLEHMIDDIDEKLDSTLPIKVKQPKTITQALKKDGSPTQAAINWMLSNGKRDIDIISGDFSKVIFEKLDLNSPQKVKGYFLENGWKPTEWNFKKVPGTKNYMRDAHGKLIKASPKFPDMNDDEAWDIIIESTNNPAIKLIAQRNKARHRLSQLRGLIAATRPDHRIEARANTLGANTCRMYHSTVVNIPKAEERVFMGKEFRSLFIVPNGRILVGGDASALEARCEAHYTYDFDKAGALEILEGDVHQRNADVFGVSRSIAKNGKYAIVYGCAPAKFAATLGKPRDMAESIYNDFWEHNIGLKVLRERLEAEYEEYGYILSIDGRPLTVRKKSALINTLFQSCGAIVMKKAEIILMDEIRDSSALLLGTFHDEFQAECNPSEGEYIGKAMVDSIRKAGEYYKLNVPLTGEYKIGLNWSCTH